MDVCINCKVKLSGKMPYVPYRVGTCENCGAQCQHLFWLWRWRPNTASRPTALAASDGKDQALPAQRLKHGS